MTTTPAFAARVRAAASTRLTLRDVQAILNAADSLRELDELDAATPDLDGAADTIAATILTSLAETVPCDECGHETTDPERCPHGREQCPECRENGNGCRTCKREAIEEAGGWL